MSENVSAIRKTELAPLRELAARVGSDLLLTQASTGNISLKLAGVLWIKASGKWMADAMRQEILIPLPLAEVEECVKQEIDPAERYTGASIETAMHAVLPHRVVLHLHCVSTIAWAVRRDAPVQLARLLEGLRWRWISFVPSGLPLARAIARALASAPDTDVLVLGNHGLVIAAEDGGAAEDLLLQVRRRLAVAPRQAHPADYTALAGIAEASPWDLPDDDAVHALGTDAVSREVLSGGLLYPCQAIFSNASAAFRSIPFPDAGGEGDTRYAARPFLIIEGRGVLLRRTLAPAEIATLGGLAQVLQRIPASAPVRYLKETEIASGASEIAHRYRELANASHGSGI